MGASIRRGLAAGLLAGLLAGFFALLVGEIPLREAIELEEQAVAAAADSAASDGHHHHHDELVDRWVQQALLPVASALVGAAFGGLFGLTFALLRGRFRETDPWRASLQLGAVAWLSVALFPALRYPATPPGVGDPDRVGARSGWFVAALLLGALGAYGLWAAARWLRSRGVPEIPRQSVVTVAAAAGFGGLFWLLPADPATAEVPAQLMWDFRLASMAVQLIMWLGLAAIFGWFWRREAAGTWSGGERASAGVREPG